MLDALAHVGRDPATGGYVRDAWSDADLELRAWFAGESARRGLDLTEDRNGNLWAWWGDPSGRPGVVTGSHLDSVRQGGASLVDLFTDARWELTGTRSAEGPLTCELTDVSRTHLPGQD